MSSKHHAAKPAHSYAVGTLLATAMALALAGCNLFSGHSYAEVDFTEKGNSAAVVGRGWSVQEGIGRWTEGKQADVNLKLDSAPTGDVVLHVTAVALTGPNLPQNVKVTANGKAQTTWVFTEPPELSDRTLAIPAGTITGQDVQVTFETPDSKTPASLKKNTDTRVLGIFVTKLSVSSR